MSSKFHASLDSLSLDLIFSDERGLTVARETIKDPDPSALVWFDIVAARVVHVGQDSCTRTLPVAFQSLQHTPQRASERSVGVSHHGQAARGKDRFRSGELAANLAAGIDTNG